MYEAACYCSIIISCKLSTSWHIQIYEVIFSVSFTVLLYEDHSTNFQNSSRAFQHSAIYVVLKTHLYLVHDMVSEYKVRNLFAFGNIQTAVY